MERQVLGSFEALEQIRDHATDKGALVENVIYRTSLDFSSGGESAGAT